MTDDLLRLAAGVTYAVAATPGGASSSSGGTDIDDVLTAAAAWVSSSPGSTNGTVGMNCTAHVHTCYTLHDGSPRSPSYMSKRLQVHCPGQLRDVEPVQQQLGVIGVLLNTCHRYFPGLHVSTGCSCIVQHTRHLPWASHSAHRWHSKPPDNGDRRPVRQLGYVQHLLGTIHVAPPHHAIHNTGAIVHSKAYCILYRERQASCAVTASKTRTERCFFDDTNNQARDDAAADRVPVQAVAVVHVAKGCKCSNLGNTELHMGLFEERRSTGVSTAVRTAARHLTHPKQGVKTPVERRESIELSSHLNKHFVGQRQVMSWARRPSLTRNAGETHKVSENSRAPLPPPGLNIDVYITSFRAS